MVSTDFKKNIVSLDFTLKQTGKESGVVLTSEYEKIASNLSPQELFALETAKDFQADAVYFRYFDDGRESVPQVYIYDNTKGDLTGKEPDIHIKVWSGCYIPLFMFIEKTHVRIFDARDKVKVKGDELTTNPIETIALVGDLFSKFSAKDFDTGLFWDEKKHEKQFKFSTSAYKDLIEGLKKVYEDFQLTSNLNSHVALKLLVQCLLIKYLEERDEEKDSGYFAKTYFKNHFNASDFCEVIRAGKLLDLLDKLSLDFNGKIFEWSQKDEKSERSAIKRATVKKLADYLDGNSRDNQYVLWRLYSFSHLPVELISSVYEELLGKGKKDTVYTPDVIASTLVDECMPLKSPKQDFKLIDISCGSGIFLVKAYKRIIQWWRYDKWLKTGTLEKPDLATLKALLVKSIYGIDIQGDAVRLAIFSLSLALLDELDPKTIWTKLRFENLNQSNILETDFFKVITSDFSRDFDLVIGNPPFNPPHDKMSNGEYYDLINKKFGYQTSIKIPDYNVALMFLSEGFKLLKEDAMLCLIQPAGPIMYQKDAAFKSAIFSKYNLLQIIDFTKLGDVLWGGANVATAAAFFQNSLPDNEDVTHIIARRSAANVKKIFLELDHYDFHRIDKHTVIYNQNVWKANSIGGGRVVSLIDRLANLRTIRDFLRQKVKQGWKKGEGFIETGDRNPADYITGKNFLPTDSFTERGIDWQAVRKCNLDFFHRPRAKELYKPPHLLIRKVLGKDKVISEFTSNYVTFLSDIFAIHAPESDQAELEYLASYLQDNSDLLRFYILTTSSRVKVNKATSIYDEDILNLPYPEKIQDIQLSDAEKIIVKDVLENILVSGAEKRLETVTMEDGLEQFATTFCNTLNSVYKTDKREFKLHKTIDAGQYWALHFEYTSKNDRPTLEYHLDLEEYLKSLIPTNSENNYNTHIQRILKFYKKDTIVLSKPKHLRYWLQSIALRDADESFSDYIKAGF
jgi:hypothetical protein